MPVVEQPASAVMLRTVSAAAPSRWSTVNAARTNVTCMGIDGPEST